MRIYIMRHGQAESGWGIKDHERQLTNEGKNELRQVAANLCHLKLPPKTVLHSPLIRTTQTTTIVFGTDNPHRPEINALHALKPGACPEDIEHELQLLQNDGHKSVAIIGHAPDVSAFCQHFAKPTRGTTTHFSPGTIACIDLSPPPAKIRKAAGNLVWILSAAEIIAEPPL